MKKSVALFCLALSCCVLSAQSQPIANSLLWRIAGNGLSKPSYLYGTIHLSDERVFLLGDSLYSAIEHCEGLALELSPADLNTILMDVIMDDPDDLMLIKAVLRPEDYDKFSPALAKLLNKAPETIRVKDLRDEKRKILQEYFPHDEMDTFLDAYLGGIAHKQGKWIGGLEDVATQEKMLNEPIDTQFIRSLLEARDLKYQQIPTQMVDAYTTGDLEKLVQMMQLSDADLLNKTLADRNKNMAGRMDTICRTKTMVFAVGAAHLPGDQGIIQLMRTRGYTLTPVFSSKKVKPADYHVKEIELPWVTVKCKKGYYQVQMPAVPKDWEIGDALEPKIYFDVFDAVGYFTYAIKLRPEQKGRDSLLENFWLQIMPGKKMLSCKDITVNGVRGKHITGQGSDGFVSSYLLSDTLLIWEQIRSPKKRNESTDRNMSRFLNSFQIIPYPFISYSNQLSRHIDSTLAFKVDLPDKPAKTELALDPETAKSLRFFKIDIFNAKSNLYYNVSVIVTKPGYYNWNDYTTLQNKQEQLRQQCIAISLDTIYQYNQRNVLEFAGQTEATSYYLQGYFVSFGNKMYNLLVLSDAPLDPAKVNQFFNSFEYLQLPRAKWSKQTSADGKVSTWAPASLINEGKAQKENNERNRYLSYETSSTNSFEIVESEYGKYYWQPSDTALWELLLAAMVANGTDTLLSQKDIRNGEFKGIEFESREINSSNIKRERILLVGNKIYELWCMVAPPYPKDPDVDRFFEDFRVLAPAEKCTLFESKAGLLLRDLKNPDTAISNAAYAALSIAPFTAADLPLLHEAFLHDFPDGPEFDQGINSIIRDHLLLLHDTATLSFAKRKYLSTRDEVLKSALLDLISNYATPENYREMTKMLLQSPPTVSFNFEMINNLTQSGSAGAALFPDFLQLLKNKVLIPDAVNLISEMIDSNRCTIQMLQPYYPDIYKYAEQLYQQMGAEEYSYDGDVLYTVNLLEKMNTPEANKALLRWLQLDENPTFLKILILKALLQNGQNIPENTMTDIAADPLNRILLHQALQAYNKEKLYPQKFNNQLSFAECLVYNIAEDRDSGADSVDLLSESVRTFNGKQARFYYFKVGKNNNTLLACAGPFNPNKRNSAFEQAVAEIYDTDVYDATKQAAQIEALTLQLEIKFKQ